MSFKFIGDHLYPLKLVFYLVVLILCISSGFHSTWNIIVRVSDKVPFHLALNRWNTTKTTRGDQNGTFASCPGEKAQLAPIHSLPSIALLSYPGSGNTWVRYLIESATGIYTGSIYCDHSLVKGGFKGNCQNPGCGCTSVVKMHYIPKGIHRISWRGVVHLMRNPYDAMIAEMNRRSSKSHTGHAKENIFKGKAWDEYVRKEGAQWSNTFDKAVSFFNRTQIIHYEDLKSDLATHLRTLLNFITADTNSSVLDASEDRFRCTLDHPTGKFKRKTRNMSFDPFTNELRAVVDEKIRYVMNKLREMKYPLPPYAVNYPPKSSQPSSSK